MLKFQLGLAQAGLRLLSVVDFRGQCSIRGLQFFIDRVDFFVHRSQVFVGGRQLLGALLYLDFQIVAGLDQRVFDFGKRADHIGGFVARRSIGCADGKQRDGKKKPLQIVDRRIGRFRRLRHDHQPAGAGDRSQTD